MSVVDWVLCGLASYLVGAIPNGLLIGLARGIDIRKHGSGNIGATNAFRTLGKGLGIATLLLDMLKGYIPAAFFACLIAGTCPSQTGKEIRLFCGICAVLGHNWPVYLRFKGGKGIATSAGALLGVVPGAIGVGLVVWLSALLVTRYVSIASIAGAIGLMVYGWVQYGQDERWLAIALTALAAVAVWRHRSNIQRLRAGTESRVTFKKPQSGS